MNQLLDSVYGLNEKEQLPKRVKNIAIASLFIGLVGIILFIISIFLYTNKDKNDEEFPNFEYQELISNYVVLKDPNEQPAVSTVTDTSILSQISESFKDKVEVGDLILGYTDTTVIYSVKQKKILFVIQSGE